MEYPFLLYTVGYLPRVKPEFYKIKADNFLFFHDADFTKEIRLNDSTAFSLMVFDVDLPYEKQKQNIDFLVETEKLPMPSWITINPYSNHFHVVYLLNKRYSKKYATTLVKYQEVYKLFSKLLNADPQYRHQWTIILPRNWTKKSW